MPARSWISDEDRHIFPIAAERFVRDLSELLRLTAESPALSVLEESSVEVACRDYDGLDGGTYGWMLSVRVSLPAFAALAADDKADLESTIKTAAQRLFEEHDHNYISQVLIVSGPASEEAAGAFTEEAGYPSRQAFYAARELDEVRPLAAGGFASVVLVTRRRLGTPLAVKFFAPHPFNADTEERRAKARQRLLREATLLATIRDPGVVRLLDFSLVAGGPALVLEYVDGKTLDAIRDEKGPLPLEAAARLLKQVWRALSACHGKSVIHRDVSPKNVIVEASGRAVLIDFGLGFSEAFAEGDRLTTQGLGTPGFRAPELEHDPLSTSPAVDVFSAGALAVFLLTGRAPQIGVRVDIPGVPAPLLDALRRALAPNPSQRLQKMRDLLAAFDFPGPSNQATSRAPRAAAALSEAEAREYLGISEDAEFDLSVTALLTEFAVALSRALSLTSDVRDVALAVLLVSARHHLDALWDASLTNNRCEAEALTAALGSLHAVLTDLQEARPPHVLEQMLKTAIARGWLREDEYDSWRPGMASGSGWRQCYCVTTLGGRWLAAQLGFELPKHGGA